jgi:hypothetical protein
MAAVDLQNYRPRHQRAETVFDGLTAGEDFGRLHGAFRTLLAGIASPFDAEDVGRLSGLSTEERDDYCNEVFHEYYASATGNDPFVRFLAEVTPTIRGAYERSVGRPADAGEDERIAAVLHPDRGGVRDELTEVEGSLLDRCWEALDNLLDREDPPSPDEWTDILEVHLTEDGPGRTGSPPDHSTLFGFLLACADCVLRAYDAPAAGMEAQA